MIGRLRESRDYGRLTKALAPGKVSQGRAYGPFFLSGDLLGGRTIGSTSDSGSDYPGSSPGRPANPLEAPLAQLTRLLEKA